MTIEFPNNTCQTRDESARTIQRNIPFRRVLAAPCQPSYAAGVVTRTEGKTFYRVSPNELQLRQQTNANLMEVAIPHLRWLSEWLANISHVAYLVDRDGIILFATGNYDDADTFGLAAGYDWSEQTTGANGAGAALVSDRPVAVIGPAHISEPFHGFTCMAAPVHDPEGRVCGAINISTSAEDANEKRLAVMAHIASVIDGELSHQRAAATATQKIKDKDRMLAEVSHELRTPLTAILGWTRLLRQSALDDVATQAVEVIERNALKQAQFIEDLLDVSRCLAGELRLNCAPVVLAPLIRNAIDSLQQTSAAKRQTLTLEIEDSVVSVSGDARRLEQVISNLVSNAIKYTPEGGRIEVKLTRIDSQDSSAGSQALIEVHDNGIGMNAEFLPHIFDYFRRANGAGTGRHEGLGLGLSIVREIVRLHGGTIEAHSDGAGCGSTFRVLLPLSACQSN